MKHDSDTEMDLLLRRHGRRSASGVAGAEDDYDARGKLDAMSDDAAHMDADELSAYAEGALPERSRSRYAAHLADCDTCRRIVTGLVISSGMEAEESGRVVQTVTAHGRSWREWFGALFSPPVLRYAIPALALFAVIAVVLVVATRKREEHSFVAMNEPSKGQSANAGVEDQRNGSSTTTATTESTDNHGYAATANANADATKSGAASPLSQQKDANTSTPSPQLDGVTPTAKSAEAPVTEPQPSKAQQREAEDRQNTSPFLSNTPTDVSKNQAKEKDDAALADKSRQENKQQASGGSPAAGTVNGRAASRSEETADSSGEFGAATTSGVRNKNETAKRAPAPAMRARRDSQGADEDASETRNVAGRRFRRQNGVWIDTAYNSSRSPLRVKRGSEQYRALVADEPIIGTVSNELGNVIVVVNGRAYHIY